MVVDWPVIKELMAVRDRLEFCLEGGLLPSAQRVFREAGFCPRADFYEDADQVIVVVELAGARESDIELLLDEGRLRVAGCTPTSCAAAGAGSYLRMERPSGRFFRDFTMPAGTAVHGEATGRLEKGILTVRVAKRKSE